MFCIIREEKVRGVVCELFVLGVNWFICFIEFWYIMINFIVLGLLLFLFLNLEVKGYCVMNGCSIFGNLLFFYKRYFNKVCNKYDICYVCVSLFFGLVLKYFDKIV